VISAGASSSSIRKGVGSLSRDGQARHVEIVHASGFAAGDLACSSSGTPARILRDWGDVDSLCGQSEPHIMLSTPMTSRRRMPMDNITVSGAAAWDR
jgi:hypothetical protein